MLLCTDAAAEGLNFQFCGALINYDLPWNPMRVEQRIGRIDRVGQKYPKIRIVNLQYNDTIETTVYKVLEERIGFFTSVVGRLQPILSSVSQRISAAVLGTDASLADRLAAGIDQDIAAAGAAGFDLDSLVAPSSKWISARWLYTAWGICATFCPIMRCSFPMLSSKRHKTTSFNMPVRG